MPELIYQLERIAENSTGGYRPILEAAITEIKDLRKLTGLMRPEVFDIVSGKLVGKKCLIEMKDCVDIFCVVIIRLSPSKRFLELGGDYTDVNHHGWHAVEDLKVLDVIE